MYGQAPNHGHWGLWYMYASVSAHVNSWLLFVALLFVDVNKALPIDFEFGTFFHTTDGSTELLTLRHVDQTIIAQQKSSTHVHAY